MNRHLQQDRYSPWPHRAAMAVCCAAFPLIWVGGLVTTYDAGMAVPDWPSTYGYNLFLYPWQTWVWGPFDLFIEHGHRLLGATVGVLSILFVAAVFLGDRRRPMRTAAVLLLALVVLQGLLGGLRVRLDERLVALVHACLGLATFAYASAMAVTTSRYWHAANHGTEGGGPSGASGPGGETLASGAGRRLLRLAVLVAGLVYVQVVFGALLRHVPVAASPMFFRLAVLFHVVLGLVILGHVVLLAVRGWSVAMQLPRVGSPLGLIGLLTLGQVGLGGATWVLKYGFPDWFADWTFAARFTVQANSLLQAMVTTLHVAGGALVLALSVVLALRAWLFFRNDDRLAGQRTELTAPAKNRAGGVLRDRPGTAAAGGRRIGAAGRTRQVHRAGDGGSGGRRKDTEPTSVECGR